MPSPTPTVNDRPSPAARNAPTVAVVVPEYKSEMTPDEQVSFRHLTHHLGGHDKYFVLPEGLRLDYPGFGAKHFAADFFRSTRTYSELLLRREFYEAFAEYDYILIYQLDCLVFSDRLLEWCRAGYDYVGGPWCRSADPARGMWEGGNGGLSLRNVSRSLAVLDSPRAAESRLTLLKDLGKYPFRGLKGFDLARKGFDLMKRSPHLLGQVRTTLSGSYNAATDHVGLEDDFWACRAKLFDPGFKVAPVEVALRFSFESFPRYCFEWNNRTLPFGCHGWYKYDKEFWTPYLME
jgi:hypothetical protein